MEKECNPVAMSDVRGGILELRDAKTLRNEPSWPRMSSKSKRARETMGSCKEVV